MGRRTLHFHILYSDGLVWANIVVTSSHQGDAAPGNSIRVNVKYYFTFPSTPQTRSYWNKLRRTRSFSRQ